MTASTASVVLCPNCGHQTYTYCSTRRYGIKIRYRKCSKCLTKIKTIQQLDDLQAGEKVVPVMTPTEQGRYLADLRAKQAKRRASMCQANSLSNREIAEIKYLLKNNVQTQAYTAMQYGVDTLSIQKIANGVVFSNIKTPRRMVDLWEALPCL